MSCNSITFSADLPVLPTVLALRAYKNYQDGELVFTTGQYANADGAGAPYVFSATDTRPDNGYTIIQPAGISTDSPGRWIQNATSIITPNIANSDDVKLTNLQGGDTLTWNSTDNLWENTPKQIKNVLDFGVVNDPNGQYIDANTAAYKTAFAQTAGKYRLYHPKELNVVMRSFATGAIDGVYWNFDGNWKLADGEKSNVFDITGWTNFVIEGSGTFDGNKAGQTGATYPQALAGITSNVTGTQNATQQVNSVGATITVPPMPIASTSPTITSNGRIVGIEILNCWNWPINLAYIQNVKVEHCKLHDSSSSPQFFESAIDCQFNFNQCYNITDGGFVFYRGNIRCSATGNNIHDCHDGIGVYAEYDMLPADSFINITDNIVWNNMDSGIGVTTGLTPPALMQQRILIANNILYSNNTGGRNGGGSIGIVGAQGVMIKDNMIFGDGNGLTVTTPSYGIFVDGVSTFIDIDGNQFGDIGCATGKGFAIFLASPNNINVHNNTVYNTQGANGVTKAFIGGGFGAACSMTNNRPLGDLAESWDQVYKPADLMLEQRSGADGKYTITNGFNLSSGDMVVSEGLLATSSYYGATAQGTDQGSAQAFNQQVIIVTAANADAGIILPNWLYGVQFTIHNRSGQEIKIYPPVGGEIEGLGTNTGAILRNTYSAQMIGFSSSTLTGGLWFGSNYPTIGNYAWT